MKKSLSPPKVKEVIIHPFAFAVFPVLFLYVENLGKGGFGDAIGVAASAVVLAALLWLFVSLFVKDKNKSAIIVSAFFVLFFSYGHAIPAVRHFLNRMSILEKTKFLVEGRSALYLWL